MSNNRLSDLEAELASLDSDFAELDAELESVRIESAAKKALAERAGAAKNKLRSGVPLPNAEREALRALVHSWELQEEWSLVGAAALWLLHECKCGSKNATFGSLLEQHQHRTQPASRRWVRVTALPADLEPVVLYQRVETPVCPLCAVSKGHPLQNGIYLEEALTIEVPASHINARP